jgi:uncharacterized repeat protein (TIGR02543 family)
MRKTVFFGLLVILPAFSFIGCDDGNGNKNGDAEFIVTFDLDGGSINGNTAYVEIKVKSGENIATLPNPQKGTDTFGGWFTQKNGVGNQFTSSTVVTSNITVYAKWTQNAQKTIIGNWANSFSNDNVSLNLYLDIKEDGTWNLTIEYIDTSERNVPFEGYWDTDVIIFQWDDSVYGDSKEIFSYSLSSDGNTLTIVAIEYIGATEGLIEGEGNWNRIE